MRPNSSLSSSADRTSTLQLLELPEEAIVAIISGIDKADNHTLSHLAQTCRDLWRLASVDALRSFFYAARSAYDLGSTDKKVAVFCVLADWLALVADQLPDETRLQILEQMADMEIIQSNDLRHLQDMHGAVESVFDLANRELKKNSNDTWDETSAQTTTDAGPRLLIINQKLLKMHSHYCSEISAKIKETNAKLFSIIDSFDF